MIHILKIDSPYYKDVEKEFKTFEVRKNDRNFKVGDYIILCENDKDQYTGRVYTGKIKYILDDPDYVKDGFVIFGFYRVSQGQVLSDGNANAAILTMVAQYVDKKIANELINWARELINQPLDETNAYRFRSFTNNIIGRADDD